MFKTMKQGDLFVYDSWSGGQVAHHKDSCHMTELVFYNYMLQLTGKMELTVPQYVYHCKCMESYRRAND